MPVAGRARRLVVIVFIGLCALWYWKQNVLNVLPTAAPSDFRFYYQAAQHILHGESPYLTPDYIYPPLLAVALVPIAGFDYLTARWLWFVFSHACLLGAAFLLWRRLGRDWIAGAVIAFVWSAGWVAQDSFATGQPDPLLVLLIVVACVSSGWMQGAAAGAGFAVKLIPAVLGLLAPLERNWRALAAFLASAALLISVPWALVALLRGPTKPANADYLFGTPCVLSWSVPSVALRVMEPPANAGKLPDDWVNGWDLPRLHLPLQQKLVSASAAFATLAGGILFLFSKTRCKVSAEQVPISGAALIALALAASPIAWWHYQAMQYPGVALLLYYAIRDRDWRRLSLSLACAVFLYPLPDAMLRHYYHLRERWPDAPGPMYFWTSVTTIASLLLFGLLLHTLQSRFSANRDANGSATRNQMAALRAGPC